MFQMSLPPGVVSSSALVDVDLDVRALRVDDRRLALDRDFFGDRADLDRDVERDGLALAG